MKHLENAIGILSFKFILKQMTKHIHSHQATHKYKMRTSTDVTLSAAFDTIDNNMLAKYHCNSDEVPWTDILFR